MPDEPDKPTEPMTVYDTDTGKMLTLNADGEWEPWDDLDDY